MRERPSPPEAIADQPSRPSGRDASFEMRAQDLRPVVRDYAKNLRRQLFELARTYGLKNPNDFSEEFAAGRVPGDDMDKVVGLVKKMTACFEKNRLPREFVREQEEWTAMARRMVLEAMTDTETLSDPNDQRNVGDALMPAAVWANDYALAHVFNARYGTKFSQINMVRALVLRGEVDRALSVSGDRYTKITKEQQDVAAGLAAAEVGDDELVRLLMRTVDHDRDAQKAMARAIVPEYAKMGKYAELEALVPLITDASTREFALLTMVWHARLAKRPADSYLTEAVRAHGSGRNKEMTRMLVAALAENGRAQDPAIGALIGRFDEQDQNRLRMVVAFRSGSVDEGRRLLEKLKPFVYPADRVEQARALCRAGSELSARNILLAVTKDLSTDLDKRQHLFSLLSDLMTEEYAAGRSAEDVHRALLLFTRSTEISSDECLAALGEIVRQETALAMPFAGESFQEFQSVYRKLRDLTGRDHPLVVSLHRAGVDVSNIVEFERLYKQEYYPNSEAYVWYAHAALEVRCGKDPRETIERAERLPAAGFERWREIRAKADLAMALAERAFGILKGNES